MVQARQEGRHLRAIYKLGLACMRRPDTPANQGCKATRLRLAGEFEVAGFINTENRVIVVKHTLKRCMALAHKRTVLSASNP